jgi:membrane protease YdiL (CAAX protease family)
MSDISRHSVTDSKPETDTPATTHPEPIETSPWIEIAVLLLVSAGGVVAAQALGPTTAGGNIAAALGLFGALAVVLLFHKLRRDPWSQLGLTKPDSWGRTILLALAATIVLQAAGWFTLNVLLPLLGVGTPDSSRFNPLRGNLGMLVSGLVSVWITAAFIEEVVFRGFLIGRLARILGASRRAWVAGVVVSAVIFGLLHFYQGVAGVILTGVMGLLFGALYLLVRRNLWIGIIAHGLIDTFSLFVIYLGLEI